MHPSLTTTLSKYSQIILVGGGTGGHIQPIVSLLSSFYKGAGEGSEPEDLSQEKISPTPLYKEGFPKFLWIGGKNSQEEQAANGNGIEFTAIPTFKLSTTTSRKVLLYPFVLLKGILEARKILQKVIDGNGYSGGSGGETVGAKKITGKGGAEREGASFLPTETFGTFGHESTRNTPQKLAVFSKGGPGSVAVGIAAWTLGIPLYIHESDTIPGRSSRLLGRFATKIFLGFEKAKEYFNPEKCEVVGQILGASFAKEVPEERRISSLKPASPLPASLHTSIPATTTWKTKKKHILVICGSQGSRAIFEEILGNLEEILKENELILVLGKLNTDMRKDFEKKLQNLKTGKLETSIQLLDWIAQEDLASLIPSTDIAITRGSATTLAELTAFANLKTGKLENLKPQLIIIPLPYSADNHQYANAKEYEKLGHTILEQKNLHLLTETLKIIGLNSRHSHT